MSRTALSVLILCFGITSALIGFDTVSPISPSAFTCLRTAGYSFFIGQVGESDGTIDQDGIQNIKNAQAAGFVDVDAYVSRGELRLAEESVTIFSQIDKVVNALNAAGAGFGTIWIRVQMDIWPTDENTNRQLILGLVDQCKARGAKVGIYTDSWAWENVVGASWKDLSALPLWWVNNNGAANFNNFKPFGGWSAPIIHQYISDAKGACSVGNVNMNWKP